VNSLFVTCGQGLEPILLQELAELGIINTKVGFRGVYVEEGMLEDVYRINYSSRIAGRVLLPLKRFPCRNRQALYNGSAEIDWLNYIPRDKTFAIDANVKHPELRNSLYAAQVVKDAICDQFREKYGDRPSVDTQDPDIQLNLYVQFNTAILSFDTSRIPLHKRGYRQESVQAPIQESLAAALLRLAQYCGDEYFCDPCCGSGTLLIEAALIATHTPPGFLRTKWGFNYLPEFSQSEWLKIKTEADEKRIPLQPGKFFGSDIQSQAVRACKINLRAAGLGQSIAVSQGDFRDLTLPFPPNFVMTNPPHGLRLGETNQLKTLYRALGDFLKRNTQKPAKGYIFTGNMELTKEVGLSAKRKHVVNNNGVESRLLEYDLY
jgi:putative N6-adenine-specific DNA methylase